MTRQELLHQTFLLLLRKAIEDEDRDTSFHEDAERAWAWAADAVEAGEKRGHVEAPSANTPQEVIARFADVQADQLAALVDDACDEREREIVAKIVGDLRASHADLIADEIEADWVLKP